MKLPVVSFKDCQRKKAMKKAIRQLTDSLKQTMKKRLLL